MNTDTVLQNLIVLSRVEVNDKLVSDGVHLSIRPPTYTRSLFRYWYNETRQSNIEALHSLLSAAINLAELLHLQRNAEGSARVVSALHPAVRGLRNLLETYRDDIDACSRLTMLVQDTDRFLSRLPTTEPGRTSVGPASPTRDTEESA